MSDKNNNFDDLKRLLKLKQHEVPPPGYFDRFSADVLSQIRAGGADSPAGVLDRLQTMPSFLRALLRVFENKPGVIGGFATSLCLVLLIGVVLADRPDNVAASSDFMASQPAPGGSSMLASSGALLPPENSGIAMSTNPVASLQPVATLFGSQNPLFQNASFVSGQ